LFGLSPICGSVWQLICTRIIGYSGEARELSRAAYGPEVKSFRGLGVASTELADRQPVSSVRLRTEHGDACYECVGAFFFFNPFVLL